MQFPQQLFGTKQQLIAITAFPFAPPFPPVYSFGVLMLETYHGIPTHKLIRRPAVPDYDSYSQEHSAAPFSAAQASTPETASLGQLVSPRPSVPNVPATSRSPAPSVNSDGFQTDTGYQIDPRGPTNSSPQHRPIVRPHPVFSAELLAFPPGCPPEYSALANACLQEDWSRRPSFFNVSRVLLALQQQVKSVAVAEQLNQNSQESHQLGDTGARRLSKGEASPASSPDELLPPSPFRIPLSQSERQHEGAFT